MEDVLWWKKRFAESDEERASLQRKCDALTKERDDVIGAKRHMDYCRHMLSVPEDETLADGIAVLTKERDDARAENNMLRLQLAGRACYNCGGAINPQTMHCDECVEQDAALLARVAALEKALKVWPYNPLDLKFDVQFRDDGRHYVYERDGTFRWSGWPVFNAVKCAEYDVQTREQKRRIAALEFAMKHVSGQMHTVHQWAFDIENAACAEVVRLADIIDAALAGGKE